MSEGRDCPEDVLEDSYQAEKGMNKFYRPECISSRLHLNEVARQVPFQNEENIYSHCNKSSLDWPIRVRLCNPRAKSHLELWVPVGGLSDLTLQTDN